jgi:radical SAM superfamily enzyme YgiQ (UPF0313 family)
MVRDEELLELLRDANFFSVFIGVESPRKSSLAETKKLQNERIDLVAALHKIQSYNLFISAGMIVGFDNDDPAIFDEQFEFLQTAQIPIAMLSVLLAVPRTPLWQRLEREGRLVVPGPGGDLSHFVGTAGGTNFQPLRMTQAELKAGQERLYRRLYAPEAFAHRLLGNMSRFQDVRFRPDRVRPFRLAILFRLAKYYWQQGPAARRFFWHGLYKALRQSPRLVNQMATFMGMYLHFCQVHGQALAWDPWQAQVELPAPLPATPPPIQATVV